VKFMENKEFYEIWDKPVIKIGTITLLLASVTTFLPCLYLYLTEGVFPSLSTALKAWGMIASLFGAFYIVEPVSYYSILGLSGTYLSFLSGNISNVRVPCAAMALEATNTEPGTNEAEVVSTLGITGSIITNLIACALAAFLGSSLISILPPAIATAFKNYTVPAIFGAVFGQFSLKYPKLAIVGIGIPTLLRFTTNLPSWVLIIVSVFGTIAFAKLTYKKDANVNASANASK
jgi:hypothetical protein